MAARRLRPALRWLPLAGAAPVCGFNGWPTHLANVEDRLCTVGEKKKLCAAFGCVSPFAFHFRRHIAWVSCARPWLLLKRKLAQSELCA